MTRTRTIVATIAVLGALGAVGGTAFVLSGTYDISALDQHTKPVYPLLQHLAAGEPYRDLLSITDSVNEVVERIKAFKPAIANP